MELIKYWIGVLLCRRHDFQWTHNFYGDAIHAHNGKRSQWNCSKCHWPQFRNELHKIKRPWVFRIEEPLGPF